MLVPFSFLYSSWGSHSKYTGVVCHSLLQWLTFCQNSPLWPIRLGCPCMAWLLASLSYASPFATTRQWSMKGINKSPLNSKIKTVNPKRNLPWIFIGRTDAEAETPILWPPDSKSWLIGKDLDAGKDWRQEEKGVTEDEMVGWHHQLSGSEFEQTLGDCEVQGSLACWGPWGHEELDTAWWLNNNDNNKCRFSFSACYFYKIKNWASNP